MKRLAVLLVVATVLLGQGMARAVPTTVTAELRLAPPVGPPTTVVLARARGFDPGEAVRIAFDHLGLRRVLADPQGRVATRITIPAQALPGTHRVAATGEQSGARARAPFTVRTDWSRFHFDAANTGLNPYENVLSPSTVGDLTLDWVTPDLGSEVLTSPAVVAGRVFVGTLQGQFYARTPPLGR